MEWNENKGLQKIEKFCAFQDRSHLEVKEKLKALGCPVDKMDEILVSLIENRFLDEERFARAYTRGKFRMKNWGRNKIRQGLMQKGINEVLTEKALSEEIDEAEYFETLEKIISVKLNEYSHLYEYERNGKTRNYAYSRGFEPELIREILGEL